MSLDLAVPHFVLRSSGVIALTLATAGCQVNDSPMTVLPAPDVEGSLLLGGQSRAMGALVAEWQSVVPVGTECVPGQRLTLRPFDGSVVEYVAADMSVPVGFTDGATASLAADQASMWFRVEEMGADEVVLLGGNATWSSDGSTTHVLTIADASWCGSHHRFDPSDCMAGETVELTLTGIIQESGLCVTGEPGGSGTPPLCLPAAEENLRECVPVPDP